MQAAVDEAVDTEDRRYFIPEHGGEHYRQLFRRLHRDLKPKNYLEVGIRKGASIRIARVPAIGVDPRHDLGEDFDSKYPHIKVYTLTSDDYFENNDPKETFGAPVDFAFLDGLHYAEALLKDFINTEKVADKNSVICLHDCVPTDVGMTRREQAVGKADTHFRVAAQWSGDVWKIIPILKRYRPDLRMAFLDAPPSGLVLITNLDPGNDTLASRYDELAEEIKALKLADIGLAEYVAGLNVRPTSSVTSREDI